jgi:hypothetical protein
VQKVGILMILDLVKTGLSSALLGKLHKSAQRNTIAFVTKCTKS